MLGFLIIYLKDMRIMMSNFLATTIDPTEMEVFRICGTVNIGSLLNGPSGPSNKVPWFS